MANQGLDFYARREQIKLKLLSGRRISSKELCEEFHVTKQTILKDMDKLPPSFPVASFKGPGGGYEYVGAPQMTISVNLFRELCAARRTDSVLSEESAAELKRLESVLDDKKSVGDRA